MTKDARLNMGSLQFNYSNNKKIYKASLLQPIIDINDFKLIRTDLNGILNHGKKS